MRLQILPWFFLTSLLLPFSEGHGWIKPRDHRPFYPNTGVQNNLPPAKPQVPDSALEYQSSFCQEGCRDGWMSYSGHCYMYVQEQRTWPEAERTCQSFIPNGHLTSISSAQHNTFLVKLAIYQARKPVLFWIGGSHQKGSSLRWSDGSRPNFLQRPLSSILNLAGGAIQQILGLNVRICLQINLGGHGRWDGANCQTRLPFICGYKPDLTPP
ncbi:snaclec bitiscetin subunit beta [Protobothrops mucrosquamatus]|uniref:snaclec bitiscetin subunit beta n=1 Tax=Protobothrops mucrosquamatus TaxID=103944 RepID=UPI000775A3DD|nr:snaclec bitiscetin subunit beta [Protobothrops mucrosquamatus]